MDLNGNVFVKRFFQHSVSSGEFMPNITLKDVAKVAGVSYATVSRALSGSSEIGEDTRKRIQKICEEMGYTPNSIGPRPE